MDYVMIIITRISLLRIFITFFKKYITFIDSFGNYRIVIFNNNKLVILNEIYFVNVRNVKLIMKNTIFLIKRKKNVPIDSLITNQYGVLRKKNNM